MLIKVEIPLKKNPHETAYVGETETYRGATICMKLVHCT